MTQDRLSYAIVTTQMLMTHSDKVYFHSHYLFIVTHCYGFCSVHLCFAHLHSGPRLAEQPLPEILAIAVAERRDMENPHTGP